MKKIILAVLLNLIAINFSFAQDILKENNNNPGDLRGIVKNSESDVKQNYIEGSAFNLIKIENKLMNIESKFGEYDKSMDRFLHNQQDVFNKIIIVLLTITGLLIGASAFNNFYLITNSINKAEKSIRKEFAEQIRVISIEIRESNRAKFKEIEEQHSLKFGVLQKDNAEALKKIDEVMSSLRKEFVEQIANAQIKILDTTEAKFKAIEQDYSAQFKDLIGRNNNALGRIYHENKSYFLSAIWYARGLSYFIVADISDDDWIKLQLKNVMDNLKLSSRIKDPKDVSEFHKIIESIPDKFKEERANLEKILEENISEAA